MKSVQYSHGLTSTAGLVGNFSFSVLPPISPLLSLLFVLTSQFPALYTIWKKMSNKILLSSLVYGSLCAYMFGYHVHEKAILVTQVLSTIAAQDSLDSWQLFALLSISGISSLFPLLFRINELLIKRK